MFRSCFYIISLIILFSFRCRAQLYIRHERQVSDFQLPEFDLDSLAKFEKSSLKQIKLNDRIILVNGLEERFRYEIFRNETLGMLQPDDDGYFLQRINLLNDLYLGKSVRFVSQLESAIIEGRSGGFRPDIDKNGLDFHQLFLEYAWRRGRLTTGVRVGRQEYTHPLRVNTPRYGTNVQVSFDAIRWLLRTKNFYVEASIGQPSVNKTATFDEFDLNEESERFWNIIAKQNIKLGGGTDVYLYYFNVHRENAEYLTIGKERRSSLGFGLFKSKRNELYYDVEFIYQWGNFNERAISAWFVGGEVTYRFVKELMSPKIGLLAHLGSGNRNRSSSLNTFYGLYPELKYGGNIYMISTFSNVVQLHPEVIIHPVKNLSVSAKYDFFWRTSADDAAYGVLQTPLRSEPLTDDKGIGDLLSLGVAYNLNKYLTVGIDYQAFYPGDFIKNTGPSPTVHYLGTQLSFYY